MIRTASPPRCLTPPLLAKHWGIKPDRVIAFIKAGHLAAFNVASDGSTRARWRISWDAVVAFENSRSAAPLPRPSRRRRRDPAVTEYF